MNQYDVAIVGAGPFGLLVGVLLSRWGYKIKIIDEREHHTTAGRADGIQPRTLDLFGNLGLEQYLMGANPARFGEAAYWKSSESGRDLIRVQTVPTCPQFIDTRYPFTTVIHQGYIEQILIQDLERNDSCVTRPWIITGFNYGSDEIYPVEITIKHNGPSLKQMEKVKAKYLIGADGSRSFCRRRLGINMVYRDEAAYVWGVIDGVVETDFPDITKKCLVQSANGSMMIIPRESGMTRLYVRIASSKDRDWDPKRAATVEQIMGTAVQSIMPYRISWKRVDWFSNYPIRQGLAERYGDGRRVFLGGDACHTHSPKAGQGMNFAFADGLNLAWKIHCVEATGAQRSILSTYESERKKAAEVLLDFDSRYASLFSTGAQPSSGPCGRGQAGSNEFIQVFQTSCELTSGYGTCYGSNILNRSLNPVQDAETNLRVGKLFLSARVHRVADRNSVNLEHEIPVDGSFRVYIFAGNISKTASQLQGFASYMMSTLYRQDLCIDTCCSGAGRCCHSRRHLSSPRLITFACVYNNSKSEFDEQDASCGVSDLCGDRVYFDDLAEPRTWTPAAAPVHRKLGIDPIRGGIIVARPDGYVGYMLPLAGRESGQALEGYFNAFVKLKKPLTEV